jgi:regulator of nonsense transcripts 2
LLIVHTADGRPMPGQPSSIDAPDDFFRVRLVCILLDGCGMCFDKGSLQQKLDSFLTFFQVCLFKTDILAKLFILIVVKLYVLSKEDLPMDVDFMLSDTLEVGIFRSNMSTISFLTSFAEGIAA